MLRNYLIGFTELGLDVTPVLEHFAEHLPPETIASVQADARLIRVSSPSRVVVPGATMVGRPIASGEGQRETLPLVSCICPTYNRPPTHQFLLEEAIESFLRQTYPNKELIVLNDCPGQELVCDAPGVRVVNVPERFPTLGEKRNAAIRLARGQLIAPWDDDDISLPWRLSLLVERLGEASYVNPDKCWYRDSKGLHPDPFIGGVYPKAMFTRSAFEAAGGYPTSFSFEGDVALETAIWALGYHTGPSGLSLRKSEWYYIYRAQVSPIHASSRRDDSAYAEIGKLPVQSGRYVLRPHWRIDYEAETRWLAMVDAGEDSGPRLDAGADSVEADTADPVSTSDPAAETSGPEQIPRHVHESVAGVVLYVVGGSGLKGNSALRDFPLINRRKGESKEAHLSRVARLVAVAMDAGGTHLCVPPDQADWLGDHPRVAHYFGANHELAEATAETGIVFRLRPPKSAAVGIGVGRKARPMKSKSIREVWDHVDRLEQRLSHVQAELQMDRVDRRTLVENLALAQPIVDSVPAIARAVAQVTRVAEELEQRMSELAAAQAAAAPGTASLVEMLHVEIRELRYQNEALRRAAPEADRTLNQREHDVPHEFVIEMKDGPTVAATDAISLTAPVIVNDEKVARARQSTIRLNLGCGHIPLDSYINVDRRHLDGVDIVADVGRLPFEAGTVGEIFSSHLLEYCPQEVLQHQLLPYWKSLLRPRGRFAAVVSDTETMINEVASGAFGFEQFRDALFGVRGHAGDSHSNALTPASLRALLCESGFVDVEVVSAGRRNGTCFEFEIVALRPDEREGAKDDVRRP